MNDSFSAIPWNTRAQWQEANACLSETVKRNAASLADLYPIAFRIRQRLESLFPTMADLCRFTCPDCTDICCQRAWVWADFKDLLFFHLADIAGPDQQLLRGQRDVCRYSGPAGCRLERIQRPFVCTWYICPDQSERLRNTTETMPVVFESLQEIKMLRKKMEASFIRALT